MLTVTTSGATEVVVVNIETFNRHEDRADIPGASRHPSARMRYEMRSAAIVACLGLVLLAACDKPQPAAEVRPVRTVTTSAGSDGEPVSLTGHIHARTEE